MKAKAVYAVYNYDKDGNKTLDGLYTDRKSANETVLKEMIRSLKNIADWAQMTVEEVKHLLALDNKPITNKKIESVLLYEEE